MYSFSQSLINIQMFQNLNAIELLININYLYTVHFLAKHFDVA